MKDSGGLRNIFRSDLIINPPHISKGMTLNDLIDTCFTSFNARSFRHACQLFVDKIANSDVLIGMSISGALTPAGIGKSSIIPMINNGLVDWMVSTGANLYHDIHSQIGYEMYMGSAKADDHELLENDIIRIYDIYFDKQALYDTDTYIRELLTGIRDEIGDKPVSTAWLHWRMGKDLVERNPEALVRSVLAAAFKYGIPIYTSSPGDSSIGLNAAELHMRNIPLRVDPLQDVNETAAIVFDSKDSGKKSAVVILGGGSPKNFILQTEPQIQEILKLDDVGHDYFIQFTDAQVHTGGLSGATPSEAVTWGKVDPAKLPDTVVCYGDVSCYYPLFIAYALNTGIKREHTKLINKTGAMLEKLTEKYKQRLMKDQEYV